MFAINHAATALVIKKVYPDVPPVRILISVQFMELIWVFLNFLGIERTTTESKVTYVGDVHLEFMPYSHSVATMGARRSWRGSRSAWVSASRISGPPPVSASARTWSST